MVKQEEYNFPTPWKVKPFDGKRVQTSLDLSKRENQAMVDRLVASRKSNVEDFIDRKVVPVNVIFIKGTKGYEESEDFLDRPYVGIVMNTGEVLSSGSSGIMMGLRDLMTIHGQPPWKNGVSITVTEVPLKGKKKTYELVVNMRDGKSVRVKLQSKSRSKNDGADIPF
ncbi:MAG: hypothetical protein ACRD1X_01605 [Vicinamibacteria bacterium]